MVKYIKSPHSFVNDLCNSLGLDPKSTTSLTIKIKLNELVLIEVEQFASPISNGIVFKKYRLMEIEEEKNIIVLAEDDRAPDGRIVFLSNFRNMFGISFEDWKKHSQNISESGSDELRYTDGKIIAICSCGGYWTIHEKVD